MNQITKIVQIIKIEIKKAFEYKLDMISELLYLPIKIAICVILWGSIYKGGGNFEYSFKWIIFYYVSSSLLDYLLTPFCKITYELMEDVRSGDLDIYLVRPFPYVLTKYFSNFKTVFTFLPIFILFLIVNNNFSIISLLGSLLMLINATIILFFLFFLIGVFSFKFENILSFRDNMWNLIKLFSGSLLPIAFYPDFMQKVSNYLPFQCIYYKPIEWVLNQNVVYFDLIVSCIWAILLFIVGKKAWDKAIRKYCSQGG